VISSREVWDDREIEEVREDSGRRQEKKSMAISRAHLSKRKGEVVLSCKRKGGVNVRGQRRE
jgi:hypothetical protein